MPRLRNASPYHAVEIIGTKFSCAASRRQSGKRYLSSEAPRLPLDDCDRIAECDCWYRHRDDRRSGPRRNADLGLPERNNPNDFEQRHGKDRRAQGASEGDVSFSSSDVSYYDYAAITYRGSR